MCSHHRHDDEVPPDDPFGDDVPSGYRPPSPPPPIRGIAPLRRLDRAAAWLLTQPVRFYRWGIGPFLPPACRFYPTCSEYALDALKLHSSPRAVWLIVRRLSRCHPLGGRGFDPVPPPGTASVSSGAPKSRD